MIKKNKYHISVIGKAGTGKSTVSKAITNLGFKFINADRIGHELLNNIPIKIQLIENFGNEILENNIISREKLAKVVFYNDSKLKILNSILHPFIIKEILTIISNNKYTLTEAAILNRWNIANHFNLIICIKSSERIIKKRLINKGWSIKKINRILFMQRDIFVNIPQNKLLILENNYENDIFIINKLLEILKYKEIIC